MTDKKFNIEVMYQGKAELWTHLRSQLLGCDIQADLLLWLPAGRHHQM